MSAPCCVNCFCKHFDHVFYSVYMVIEVICCNGGEINQVHMAYTPFGDIGIDSGWKSLWSRRAEIMIFELGLVSVAFSATLPSNFLLLSS